MIQYVRIVNCELLEYIELSWIIIECNWVWVKLLDPVLVVNTVSGWPSQQESIIDLTNPQLNLDIAKLGTFQEASSTIMSAGSFDCSPSEA